MALTYATAIKTARMEATRDVVIGGTLEVRDSTNAVLVAYNITVGGGTVSGDTWTITVDSTTVAATAAGTADNIVIKNSAGSVRISGLSVGLSGSGANAIIDNTSIAVGQNVTLTSATIQHAADPA